jgi:hypothetical protein
LKARPAQLRGQTALINTLITTQARIDEARLWQKDEEKKGTLSKILAEMKAFKAAKAVKDAEDARRAREKGWCDDSLSDKTAAAIYREKTYPWLGKPHRSPTGN